MNKTTKLEVNIDKVWEVGLSASFKLNEYKFSDHDSDVINENAFIDSLRKVLRKSDGFNMLSIDVTYGETYSTNRQVIASYRFVREYDGIRMSMASPSTGWNFKEWNEASIKDVYKYTKICVEVANRTYIKSVRESVAVTQ